METFSPEESRLFYTLLTLKHFQPDTKSGIARQLKGSFRSERTRQFIESMIKVGCLTWDGMKRNKNGQEYPVYRRDKRRMRKFFETTVYYHTAEELYTLIDLPAFEIG